MMLSPPFATSASTALRTLQSASPMARKSNGAGITACTAEIDSRFPSLLRIAALQFLA
jgi:hypothetical protein